MTTGPSPIDRLGLLGPGLPDRVDPVRPADRPVVRRGRHPDGRLGQHRRDQRRPGPRLPVLRGRLPARLPQGVPADPLPARCWPRRRPAWRCPTCRCGWRSRRSSGTTSRSTSSSRAARGSRPASGRSSRSTPFASVAAATGFAIFLLLTRYVSMSSILGGLVWLIAHFVRVEHPLARDQIAMTVASIGLMGLLIARHRKNLARIARGDRAQGQPPQEEGRRRPSGRVAPVLVVGLAVAGGRRRAFGLNAAGASEVVVGPYRVAEVARVATGHQRAERLAFADRGRLLAATCPRYDRVMLYRVTEADGARTRPRHRPRRAGPSRSRRRPTASTSWSARTTTPATSRKAGGRRSTSTAEPVGPKVRVGFYPDDLADHPRRPARPGPRPPGRGEGGDHRPLPVAGRLRPGRARSRGRPARLRPARRRPRAAGPLGRRDDGRRLAPGARTPSPGSTWPTSASPGSIARRAWPDASTPDALRFDHRGGLLAADEAGEALWHQAGPDGRADHPARSRAGSATWSRSPASPITGPSPSRSTRASAFLPTPDPRPTSRRGPAPDQGPGQPRRDPAPRPGLRPRPRPAGRRQPVGREHPPRRPPRRPARPLIRASDSCPRASPSGYPGRAWPTDRAEADRG